MHQKNSTVFNHIIRFYNEFITFSKSYLSVFNQKFGASVLSPAIQFIENADMVLLSAMLSMKSSGQLFEQWSVKFREEQYRVFKPSWLEAYSADSKINGKMSTINLRTFSIISI